MAVNLSPVGGVAAQFFTSTGAVLTGGKIYTYLAGTTTPTPTYTTSAGNVARTNPIVLDAAGRVPGSGEIWITGNLFYKFVLKDSNDVLIGTYDNISSQVNTDASLVTYTPAGIGAVTTTVQAKLRETVSVMDFGATGDGSTDDTAAIQTALNSTAKEVFFPAGTYSITGVTLTASATTPQKLTGIGNPKLLLQSGTNRVALTVDQSTYAQEYIYVDGFTIQSTGTGTDGNNTTGIYMRQGSHYVSNVRVLYFSDTAIKIAPSTFSSLTNFLAFQSRYGVQYTQGISGNPTIGSSVANVTHGYITGCTRGFFATVASSVYLDTIVFEYCGVSTTDAALHLLGGGYELNNCYWEANVMNILSTDVSCINQYPTEFAATNANSITYAGAGFDVRGWTTILPYKTQLARISPDYVGGQNLTFLNNYKTFGTIPTADTNGSFDYMKYTTVSGFADAGGYWFRSTSNAGSRNWKIQNDSTYYGALQFAKTATFTGSVYTVVFNLNDDLSVTPGADNTQTLGSASNRWSVVYAGTGTINTSDSREKQQVRDLLDAEKAVAVRLKGLLKAFKFNDSVETKGDDARIHFGVVAQDVKAAFEAEGLDADKYALFCYDEWPDVAEVLDEEDNVVIPAQAAGNRYGIRYEELLTFIIAAI
jgi:hypothetical protein